MRLKAIEMQGFKSFPDKTRINFDSGVTAIIGPNGSGKSNISDAIRWVLGEMSVKSLRGSRMEDVIFNGTANRAAANCASVSLVIDTEEEYNRANNMTLENTGSGESGEESEKEKKEFSLSSMPEITVTRKLYRSGESEYYINKKQVRLKDIYELFYDTGIGREGYSVIGQGRIAEVLSQKDDERRSIFEEAAGISKIRYKKLEAERKLRDTEANLVRVEDILSEISARVGPLEKEAENAKQYLVLSEEKKGIEITMWLDRIDLLRERRAESEEALAEAKTELEAAEMQAAQLDTATDRLLNESYEISRAVAECERVARLQRSGKQLHERYALPLCIAANLVNRAVERGSGLCIRNQKIQSFQKRLHAVALQRRSCQHRHTRTGKKRASKRLNQVVIRPLAA